MIKRLDFKSLPEEIATVSKTLDESALLGDNWTLIDPVKRAVFDKMKAGSIPLGDYLRTKIYRGVLSGLTDAFVIDGNTARRIIKKNRQTKPFIKPFALGDDVRHYTIQNRDRFLICIPNGWTRENAGQSAGWDWFARKFPALAKHLAPFAEIAKRRWDKGEFWWELRPCDYYDIFEKPKIVYPDIAKESRFALDEDGYYTANTTYIIPVADKYLLAILNSRLIWEYYKSIAAVLGDADKGGRLRWFTQDVVRLPIAKANKECRIAISQKVDAMLAAKKALAKAKTEKEKNYYENKCATLDRQIDKLVYELYGLTEEEIRIIEGTPNNKERSDG
jgi:hypothetical protein